MDCYAFPFYVCLLITVGWLQFDTFVTLPLLLLRFITTLFTFTFALLFTLIYHVLLRSCCYIYVYGWLLLDYILPVYVALVCCCSCHAVTFTTGYSGCCVTFIVWFVDLLLHAATLPCVAIYALRHTRYRLHVAVTLFVAVRSRIFVVTLLTLRDLRLRCYVGVYLTALFTLYTGTVTFVCYPAYVYLYYVVVRLRGCVVVAHVTFATLLRLRLPFSYVTTFTFVTFVTTVTFVTFYRWLRCLFVVRVVPVYVCLLRSRLPFTLRICSDLRSRVVDLHTFPFTLPRCSPYVWLRLRWILFVTV